MALFSMPPLPPPLPIEIHMQRVARSEIKFASPDVCKELTSTRKTKIGKSIERFGIVQPPVWNKRTGNLVDGCARLMKIDDLQGSKNYSLHCAVVDLDDAQEKALRILLNGVARDFLSSVTV